MDMYIFEKSGRVKSVIGAGSDFVFLKSKILRNVQLLRMPKFEVADYDNRKNAETESRKQRKHRIT